MPRIADRQRRKGDRDDIRMRIPEDIRSCSDGRGESVKSHATNDRGAARRPPAVSRARAGAAFDKARRKTDLPPL